VQNLLIFFILCICSSVSYSQTENRDLIAKVTEYCSVREATTSQMIEGRDKGISKERVLSQLPPLTAASTDAERATLSRLNDVYAMKGIGIKTMSAHRFFGCLLGAMKNKEPMFNSGLEESLLDCQNMAVSVDEHLRCVRTAQRKHLIN